MGLIPSHSRVAFSPESLLALSQFARAFHAGSAGASDAVALLLRSSPARDVTTPFGSRVLVFFVAGRHFASDHQWGTDNASLRSIIPVTSSQRSPEAPAHRLKMP
ncbi:hypothetical protein MTO96_005401 [Rhipicephalus appendiculatus]